MKNNDLIAPNVVEVEKQIKYLKEFIDSDGWKLIKENIERQLREQLLAFGGKLEMSEKEIDFRRGALNAIQGFTDYPERLIQELESSLPIKN